MKNLLLAILFCFPYLIHAQQLMKPETLWDLGRVNLEGISPDGKITYYTVRDYSLTANKSKNNLYSIDNTNKSVKRLTTTNSGISNIQLSKDGKNIYYLNGAILMSMNADGTDQTQLSDTEMGGFWISPTEKNILYIADVKYIKETKELYPELPLAKVKIFDGLMYRHWNQWEDYHRSNVFVSEIKNNAISEGTNIMQGEPFDCPLMPDGGMEQIAWNHDGTKIAYTSRKLNGTAEAVSTNSDIYVYDMNTKKTTNVSQGMNGYDTNPLYSPDGKYLVWNSMEKAGYEADRIRIMQQDISTGKIIELTKGYDYNTSNLQYNSNGKLYFINEYQGTTQICSIDNGRIMPLTQSQHNYTAFAMAGNKIVASRSSMTDPIELFDINSTTGEATRLTTVTENVWNKVKKATVVKRMVKTTDGKEMLVWVILPPDFDKNKKYPTLLYCQGGPQSMLGQGFSYRWNYQLMASNGYIVVAPCRRGMPGFGQAWNEQISGDWGGQCMKDYLSAIDDVAKESYVNKDKLGCVGASFGGYSVYWLAGNHQKRFKAFISHAGIFNFESMYGTTEELWFENYEKKGAYWDNPRPKSYATSPHLFVKNWDTPILITQGGKDFRVPESEAMQAFQAAQLRGIPSKYVYLPEEAHQIFSPQNAVVWQKEFYGWLDKYLK
jgi:dipeptidyl aminopeptidase/acylaminoacyl peptidase